MVTSGLGFGKPTVTDPASQHSADWAVMLHGFIDGEIDSVHALKFEAHLSTCPLCRREVERFTTVGRTIGQDGVRWQMPDHVRARVLDALEKQAFTSSGRVSGGRRSHLVQLVRQWSFVPAAAALAVSLFLVVTGPRMGQSLQDELLASHIHSLLASHLTDVQSSDQHTVKPWFNGKADFSPPVVDLAAEGFPLVGGRLDYVGGRVVATVVYRRRQHIINLFMWPAQEMSVPASQRQGYNILPWTAGGTTFCAVSDVSEQDLQTFRRDLSQTIGP